MGRRRLLLALVPLALVASLGAWTWTQRISATVLDLPARLTDQEFWHLVEDFSEPAGYFRSDNLVSNETTFQFVIPELIRAVAPGGVYLGVGPDQNFTYIAALQPRLAFITDVRRGNLHTHLMYKALFDLSADRVEFVARLFSRARPPTLAADASPQAIFDAFAGVEGEHERFRSNLAEVIRTLTETRGFRLTPDDLDGIAYVYEQFFFVGPDLAYTSGGGGRGFGRTRYPTFRSLQTATDQRGFNHAYLGSDAAYQRVRALQRQNLIVPLVGNFAGRRALRSMAEYLSQRRGVVTAFYTSNVEQYLFQDRLWDEFAANVAILPTDRTSLFIRSCFNSCTPPPGSRSVTLLDPIRSLLADFESGRVLSYRDVLNHTR